MSDQRTELEIRIRTIAEEQGVTLTEQGLQRVKERTQQLAHSTGSASDEFKGFTDAQKQQAHQALRNIEANERGAQTAEKLGKNINSVRGAFGGLKDILSGGLNGNLLQVGEGLGKIASAAGNASGSVRGLFAQMARGGAAGAALAAPVLVLIQAMKAEAADAEAADAEAAMKRWWDQAAKGAEAYKTKSAEVKAAAEKDLEQLLSGVQRLRGEWDSLISTMDRAEQRADQITAARKELELATAKTPEERAAIEARYASTGLANDAGRADLRIQNAEATQRDATQQIRNAEAKVRDAQAAFNANPTRAGREAITAAQANLEKVKDEVSPVFKESQSIIDNARTAKEVTDIRRQTLGATTAKSTATNSAASKEKVAELRATAERAQAAGNFGEQDRAVAELRRLESAATKLSKAVVESGATTSAALEAAAKEAQKQKERAKNTAEARAGN